MSEAEREKAYAALRVLKLANQPGSSVDYTTTREANKFLVEYFRNASVEAAAESDA